MQQLTGTMITNPRHDGPEQGNRPKKAGSAGPVTGNRYRGTVRGGRVTGQDRTAQDRATLPASSPGLRADGITAGSALGNVPWGLSQGTPARSRQTGYRASGPRNAGTGGQRRKSAAASRMGCGQCGRSTGGAGGGTASVPGVKAAP